MSEKKEKREKKEKSENVFKRQDLMAAVAEKVGLPRTQAATAIDAILETITEQLKGGQEVRLTGFGAFVLGSRAAGKGRDPRTGAEIDIPAARTVRFRAGKGLRDAISGNASESE